MRDKTERQKGEMSALSLDKIKSLSKIMRRGVGYGVHSFLVEADTDAARDIFKYPVRIDAYIFVVCSDGLIELTNNLYQLTLSANSMTLFNPGAIVRINALRPTRLHLLVFTREFIGELGLKLGNTPLQYKIARDHKVFSISRQECWQLESLMSMTADFIQMDSSNPLYNEMVKSTFRSFIYRAIYLMNERYDQWSGEILPTQDNIHFNNFMRLLEENYKSEHSIKFYSDKMNLSPKYLSLLIKKVSGKLATEWIDEYIILEAKNLIKYSSKSIQEISYALNFPNQSFFGKYFKRHTGVSPKAYRLQP